MKSMKSMIHNINFETLDLYVSKLKEAVAAARGAGDNNQTYMVEVAKALGFASGASQEAAYLAQDMTQLIKAGAAKAAVGDEINDLIDLLEGGSKTGKVPPFSGN